MRFEVGPVDVVAANDQPLPRAPLEISAKAFGNRLEVLQSFFGHSPLGRSSLITVVAIAGGASRKQVDDGCALSQIIEAQIKEAGALPIDDRDAKGGLGAKQRCQRLQLKTGLEINAGRSKTRGQIVFPPEVLSRAGEHC